MLTLLGVGLLLAALWRYLPIGAQLVRPDMTQS